MNGAENLSRTLISGGVNVCFANPGTSEIHFVAALDKVDGMRAILGLFEGVVTGAADGYGRMAGKPACTLLHLGPGLANGLANLHNARRAATPMINIIGDHATFHQQYDAPLASDVAAIARPVSDWVHSSASARNVAADATRAMRAALEPPGQVATLIVPADAMWHDADFEPLPPAVRAFVPVPGDIVDRIARTLRPGTKTAFILRGPPLKERGLQAAGRIAAKTGAHMLCDTFVPRIQRGAGRFAVQRIPYLGDQIAELFQDIEQIVLVGAKAPVTFFGHPSEPSFPVPSDCRITVLSHAHEDGTAALEAIADAVGALASGAVVAPLSCSRPADRGPLDAKAIMQIIACHLPENAIISDESATSGFPYFGITATAAPHDYLNVTGGAIGSMMPVGTGAAVACPDRKVVCLQGDGGAMYTLQALWTQAREGLDVTTIIYANRSYAILKAELSRMGVNSPGEKALSLFDLHNPTLDWVKLAEGMGVEAARAETVGRFADLFASAMKMPGPCLIEAVI